MSVISIQHNETFGQQFGNKYNMDKWWGIIILIILILCVGGGLFKILRNINHTNLGVYEQRYIKSYTDKIPDLVLIPASDVPLY